MRSVLLDSLLGGLLAFGAASAHAVLPPGEPASAPALPASVAMPANAASRLVPERNPAVTAAENAQDAGSPRPEGRLVPQIQMSLGAKRIANNASLAASAPPGSVPGRVNPGAARCLAMSNAAEKAACERGLPASASGNSAR